MRAWLAWLVGKTGCCQAILCRPRAVFIADCPPPPDCPPAGRFFIFL